MHLPAGRAIARPCLWCPLPRFVRKCCYFSCCSWFLTSDEYEAIEEEQDAYYNESGNGRPPLEEDDIGPNAPMNSAARRARRRRRQKLKERQRQKALQEIAEEAEGEERERLLAEADADAELADTSQDEFDDDDVGSEGPSTSEEEQEEQRRQEIKEMKRKAYKPTLKMPYGNYGSTLDSERF